MATVRFAQPSALRRVAGGERHQFGATAKLGVAIVTLAAGVVALTIADGSTRDVGHNIAAQLILAFSFLFSLGVIATVSLSSRMSISIQILMLYFAIYLILPGYNHTTRGSFPFFSIAYPSWMIQNSALIVLVFLMCVTGCYMLMASKTARAPTVPRPVTRFEPNTLMSAILTACAYAGAIAYVRAIGIGAVFSTRDQSFLANVDAQSSGLLIALPRMLCVISVVYTLMVARYSPRKVLGLVLFAINFIPAIFVLWPIGLPRSALFGLILFISMVLFKFDRPDRRLLLSILYLFGALVAMPLMDALTRGGRKLEELNTSVIMGQYFRSGDFDGLQSINNIVLHTNRFGYEYGHQLLSALLFFVPRAYWSGKAEPTGSVVANTAGYNFLNVSMPLPGEFFIDGGWFAVVGGGLFVGWALQKIDFFIDRNWFNSQKGRLVAGLMAGYTIVLYRGTLIGIVAPFAVLTVLVIVTSKFGLRPIRPRPGRP